MILAVVLANAVIGFVQEGKAEAAMAAIRDMLAPNAAVLRDGRRQTMAGAELVPGDIVLLEAGDKVPADLRVSEARGLAAQEAILTGESVPVEKGTSAGVAEAASLVTARSCFGRYAGHQGTAAGSSWQPARKPKSDVSAACWPAVEKLDDSPRRADGCFRALADAC